MSELVSRFAAYARDERHLLARTVADYVNVLEAFDTFLATEVDGNIVALEAVSAEQISAFLRIKQSRWNLRLAALRSFYKYLRKQELIAKNPAMNVERVRSRPRPRYPLSLDEFLRLLDAVEAHSPAPYRTRNVAMLQVAFHCGFRVTEVVNLDLDQVDFENRVLLRVRTKGDKQRPVEFNDVVAEALEFYLQDSKRVRPADGEAALFVSNRGRRLSVRTIQKAVRGYAKRAGISRDVTPHLLRHSVATALSREGVGIAVIQQALGHEDVRTTQRYISVGASELREASDKVGNAYRRRQRARNKRKGGTKDRAAV